MKNELRSHRLLAGIVALFCVLGVVYSVTTPIFEAGDELWHYPFVQWLATGHSLPVQDPTVKTLWEQEGGQPPLYYALSALATAWIDTRDVPERLWTNPEAKTGITLVYGNKNLIVHTSAESFPWHNTALAVHLIRLLSILLSAVTVVCTYGLALEIRPGDKTLAALAAALVAFNPMFLFISASVNNDNLAVMLATLALLLLARLVTRGPTLRRLIVLGIVLGLAALSKASDIGLLGLTALVFALLLWRAWRQRARPEPETNNSALSVPQLVAGCLACAGIVAALAGWWYARNWMVYGDPFAFNVWVEIAGGRPTPATPAILLGEVQGFLISFWGNFGGVNVIAPGWVYTALNIATLLAGIGLLIGIARRTLPSLLALPAVWLAVICAALVRWTWLTLASQGRLIFPAIAAVAVLLAFGLAQLPVPGARLGRRLAVLAPAALATGLFLFAALAPFTLIAPTYALAARLPDATGVPNPVHIVYDNQAELVGYELPQRSVKPGEELPLTLYWRARTPMTEDFSIVVNLSDADGKIVTRWRAFPGRGLYPTRLWQPGEVVVDAYRLPVGDGRRGSGRIEVALFRRLPLETLTARDPQGQTIAPYIARFKLAGTAGEVRVENPIRHEFADQLALVGYRMETANGALQVRLYWQARTAMKEDYKVFVHLLDAGGALVTQKDNEPQNGTYPTSYWDAGEIVADDYTLVLPGDTLPENARIEVGVYHAGDGTRLPVQGGGDSVVLGK